MQPHLFIKVTAAKYLTQYRILITFSGNRKRIVDFKKLLKGGIFKNLADEGYFKQFKVNKYTHTIEWPNGADFSPDFLFKIGKEI